MSWIVLIFVGLRKVSGLVVWLNANDRGEACEILEDRLQEVEIEAKEVREGLCWSFSGAL